MDEKKMMFILQLIPSLFLPNDGRWFLPDDGLRWQVMPFVRARGESECADAMEENPPALFPELLYFCLEKKACRTSLMFCPPRFVLCVLHS